MFLISIQYPQEYQEMIQILLIEGNQLHLWEQLQLIFILIINGLIHNKKLCKKKEYFYYSY